MQRSLNDSGVDPVILVFLGDSSSAIVNEGLERGKAGNRATV